MQLKDKQTDAGIANQKKVADATAKAAAKAPKQPATKK